MLADSYTYNKLNRKSSVYILLGETLLNFKHYIRMILYD